ncbi:hypothetical protein [Vibrio sp. SCSIO 43137]|uniref:hypothetical protein n=1 Tax=Vibrio sp. SCSIO 43137 TaxID=3021011 RepID=UPI002307C4E2|nr:hypothetical protein [Vibrio sp. SCSIO 43137]WCE30974.1 hypothetical protein PK654_06835 [Vibrio sp. SCSIO 43137]
MFTKEGVCDWCNKLSLLTRHDYVDGKCHFSCAQCNDMARLDVRLFNRDELALNGRSSDINQ